MIELPNSEIFLTKSAWDDLRFPAAGINPPGAASDPARDTSDGRLVFSSSATNIIAIQVQMPHAWKQGSAIRPHIHWSPTSTNTGAVRWQLDYKVANINEAFPGSWTTLIVDDPGDGVTNQHQIVSFAEIAMTGKTLSCMILMLVSRIGGAGEDTYTGTAKLNEFDIHYEVDSFGSRQEFVK